MSKLNKAKQILKNITKNILLQFYEEISNEEKSILLDQILQIDFKEILDLYNNSMKPENLSNITISPLQHIEKNLLLDKEINYYKSLGEAVIKSNSFAVITMAGGQGTRLGYKGPKGTYMLDLSPIKKSLFQIMAEDIKQNNKKYNTIIPWYIMTSGENDFQTRQFFEINDFFEYPKEKIKFFKTR